MRYLDLGESTKSDATHRYLLFQKDHPTQVVAWDFFLDQREIHVNYAVNLGSIP